MPNEDSDVSPAALNKIAKADLNELGHLLRRVAKHDAENHNCLDTAMLLTAVAGRLEYLHRMVQEVGRREKLGEPFQ
jgi:hypothetical protein